MTERAGIFEGVSDFDVSGFAPKQETTTAQASPHIVRAVSEASSFRSREPQGTQHELPPRKEPRRYRTGRNVQLNIKVRAETLKAFYEIADSQGWVLGEALERAVASLAKELSVTQ